jgi:hypothetical protein
VRPAGRGGDVLHAGDGTTVVTHMVTLSQIHQVSSSFI